MAQETESALQALAAKIRAAYLETTVNAYEDAAANGLCAQGAWEVAVEAMRHFDVGELLRELPQPVSQPAAGTTGDQISSRLPSGSRR